MTNDKNQINWAVQPAAWANFDPDGAVYCLDIHTAYRVARDQKAREGDQMIWRMTSGKPIKWVRVTDDEVAQSAYQGAQGTAIISIYTTKKKMSVLHHESILETLFEEEMEAMLSSGMADLLTPEALQEHCEYIAKEKFEDQLI